MSTVYNEVWKDIFSSLPQEVNNPIDTKEKQLFLPILEILKTIFFCLQDGIEQNDIAIKLLDSLSHLRKDVAFLNWKAMVEYDAKKYIRAFETTEKILQITKSGETYFNAGRTAYKANKLEKSKQYLQKAMDLMYGESAPILDYAVTICTMGDFEGALEIIENIDKSSLDEKNEKIVDFNKGWHYIREDNFKEGIALLHLGREINVWGSHAGKYKKPMWNGQTEKGKTILMIGEGGIGDEVINARFAKTIKERGMNVIMSTVHKNERMLSQIDGLRHVIRNDEINTLKGWDYWVPVMDLPYILGIDKDEIPHEKYLTANPHYIDKWKKRIKSNKKLNIGIRWMGNPRYELELARTIPLEYFEKLTDLDVQLWSIQKDDEKVGLKLPNNIIDISEELESWDDTMGAMMNFDLVITSCTSVAHIAGALGVPTWVVTPLLPYYIWADMKKESYWYDSVSLYRQKEWKNWNEPMKEVRKDLEEMLCKLQ